MRTSNQAALRRERAENAGMTAAANGRPYSDNPHGNDAELKLAWSGGHNGMRARMLTDMEERRSGR